MPGTKKVSTFIPRPWQADRVAEREPEQLAEHATDEERVAPRSGARSGQ